MTHIKICTKSRHQRFPLWCISCIEYNLNCLQIWSNFKFVVGQSRKNIKEITTTWSRVYYCGLALWGKLSWTEKIRKSQLIFQNLWSRQDIVLTFFCVLILYQFKKEWTQIKLLSLLIFSKYDNTCVGTVTYSWGEFQYNNYDRTRKCEMQNKVYTKLAPENTLTSAITK